MAQDINLAYQLSGSYAQALIAAVNREVLLASGEISAMENFNYLTAPSGILTTMGQLVGFLWPLVPSGLAISGGHYFTMYSALSGYVNPHFVAYSGFGSVISGGTLSGVWQTYYANTYVGQSIYAQLLPLAASLKYNGLTLANIDATCQLFGTHTITFASGVNNGDIKVLFNPDISALQLNVANQIFQNFATEPAIQLYNA
jgi:hypothetical protein